MEQETKEIIHQSTPNEAEQKKYYFYVLYCKDQTLYAGYTVDLQARLATHNSGKGAKYTQALSRRPARMIYAEVWSTKSLAMKAEARFKKLSRQEKFKYLRQQGLKSLFEVECWMRDFQDQEELL